MILEDSIFLGFQHRMIHAFEGVWKETEKEAKKK